MNRLAWTIQHAKKQKSHRHQNEMGIKATKESPSWCHHHKSEYLTLDAFVSLSTSVTQPATTVPTLFTTNHQWTTSWQFEDPHSKIWYQAMVYVCTSKRHENIWALYPPPPKEKPPAPTEQEAAWVPDPVASSGVKKYLLSLPVIEQHILSPQIYAHTPPPPQKKGISICSMAFCAVTSPNKTVLTGKLFTGNNSLNLCHSAPRTITNQHSEWMRR